jgi:hypothetical protein
MKQLEEVIHEIRRMMVKSKEEVVSKEKMERGKDAREAGNMQ